MEVPPAEGAKHLVCWGLACGPGGTGRERRQRPYDSRQSCGDKDNYGGPSPFGCAQGQDDGEWEVMTVGDDGGGLGQVRER